MSVLQTGCITPLPCSLGRIGSLAYNGCNYAMPTPRCAGVTKLDGALCPVETLHTERKYSSLCYDEQEQCYWAGEEGNSSTLFRLDLCFCEIGTLALVGACKSPLFGISCDPCCDALLLVYPDSILTVDKCSGRCSRISCPTKTQLNLGVLALCGGYVISYLQGGLQYIEVHCKADGTPEKMRVPQGFSLEAMVLCGLCHEREQCCITYTVGLLLSNQCNGELSFMQLLVSCCGGEHLPHPPVPPCPPHPPVPPCPPHPPVPPCPPKPPCPPTPCCQCGKYEIMHSVALEEAGIAHILNAEGEKLQKAVAESKTINELLCINESVKRTITQITLLEGQLFSKLESLNGICDTDSCGENRCPHCGGGCSCQ